MWVVQLLFKLSPFTNIQNNAAYFRIGNGGDDSAEYVSRVEVTLLP